MKRPLLTLRQARARLSCGDSKIRQLVKRGELPACQIGQQWRIDEADLEAFIEQQKAATNGPTVRAAVDHALDADELLDPVEQVFS